LHKERTCLGAVVITAHDPGETERAMDVIGEAGKEMSKRVVRRLFDLRTFL